MMAASLENTLLKDQAMAELHHLNLSASDVRLFSGMHIGFGVVNILSTFALIFITFLTSTRENMKVSEKLVLYNALIPDLLSILILLTVISPAIRYNEWTYNEFKTTWIAFINTTCIFHSHLAVTYICDLIVLSLTDSYKFHAADRLKYMSALVICSLSITACFCSLPACEEKGFIFVHDRLSPTFNIRFQYGSLFMVLAMLGIIIPKYLINLVKLIQVRRFFIDNTTKITKRAMKDLELLILFTGISTFNVIFLVPAIVGSQNLMVTVCLELLVYVCPLVRVLTLYLLCPHFHFGMAGRAEEYIDEFAILSVQDEDKGKLNSVIEVAFDVPKQETSAV